MGVMSRTMLRVRGSFTAILFFFSFCGCASIIKGSAPQQISLKTEPTDAKCVLTDLRSGSVIMQQNSPILTQLKRDSGYFKNIKYRFSCEKDGFKQNQVDFESDANGWYIGGNILFGGLIGWLIVDPATGAMWSFTSDDITLALELPVPVSPSTSTEVSTVTSYFQGIWVGSWQYGAGEQNQETTITVGKKNPDGTFDTEYSWGYRKALAGSVIIWPGTIKVKGREDEDKFVFEFSNPDNYKINSIVLTKHESEKVKAKMEGVLYAPDGYLTRK